MPKLKTHCPQGHEFSEENTYTDSRGYRHCKTCRRDRMRARREYSGSGPGAANAAKTHCPKGHEYTEENTYWMPSKTSKTGYARACRECNRLRLKSSNITRYGITVEEFEALVEAQDGECAICKREFENTRERHIDHDHSCCEKHTSCGKCIRGVLCGACNKGLGLLRDDPAILEAAVQYLRK